MPKTDVTDDRSLSRLQGIDFREHANQNTAHDACNVRLDHTSRLVPYPRPTKLRRGSFTFACESKNPALEEFDLDLDPYFGAPAITSVAKGSDGISIVLSGSHLANCSVILSDEDGNCVFSDQDFSISFSNGDLVLDIRPSSFSEFDTITITNSYGSSSSSAEITGRNNIVCFGSSKNDCLFKMGVDPETLCFTIWGRNSDGSFSVVYSKIDSAAKTWKEDASSFIYTDYLNISASESQKWLFIPEGFLNSDLNLKLVSGYDLSAFGSAYPFVGFGSASGTATLPSDYHEILSEYTFGQFSTYRLYAPYGEHKLLLQMKSDSASNNYDITLQEWEYTS